MPTDPARQTWVEGPPLLGLCPGEHHGEFYMPLEVGQSTICPSCDLVMIVYKRFSDPAALAGTNDQIVERRYA